jgi:NTE family protein
MSLIREAVGGLKKIFTPRAPGLVLALGGGGARGLAHIGVLQALVEHAIPMRAVVGTSIGAEIGAFLASGMPLDELTRLATGFDWKQTLLMFLPDLPAGGLTSGVNIASFLRSGIGTRRIEELAMGYAAVAADLESGEEVVLDQGELVEAVRASISLPGLMAPHRLGRRLLVDGGVLNPLPFDVARERFGGPVVAVAVHAGAQGLQRPPPEAAQMRQGAARVQQLLDQPWMRRAPALRAWLEAQLENYRARSREKPYWTARRVLDRVFDIGQKELVRLRARASPPDLLLTPDVGDIGALEFYRAQEAIAAGYEAARARRTELEALSG